MTLSRRPLRPPVTAIDPDLLTLMIASPWAVGKDLLTAPNHDTLRALWTSHETKIRLEAARRGVESIWYLERDWFVRLVRGEER